MELRREYMQTIAHHAEKLIHCGRGHSAALAGPASLPSALDVTFPVPKSATCRLRRRSAEMGWQEDEYGHETLAIPGPYVPRSRRRALVWRGPQL